MPSPEWTAADEDDEARAQSSFDRADNTARLALEVADLKRERADLRAKVAAVEALAHEWAASAERTSTAPGLQGREGLELYVETVRHHVRRLRAALASAGRTGACTCGAWESGHCDCPPAASVGRTEPEPETSGKRHDGTVSARWVGLNCPVCGSGEDGDCLCDRAEAIARAEWVASGKEVTEGPWETVLSPIKSSLIRKALPDAYAAGRTEPEGAGDPTCEHREVDRLTHDEIWACRACGIEFDPPPFEAPAPEAGGEDRG